MWHDEDRQEIVVHGTRVLIDHSDGQIITNGSQTDREMAFTIRYLITEGFLEDVLEDDDDDEGDQHPWD